MNSDHILQLAQSERLRRFSADTVRRIELGLGAGNVHIDRALSNLAVMFSNRDYVADRVMPVIRVAKKSDKYFKFNANTMFNVAAVDVVGAESMPGRPSIGLDTPGTYSCIDRALRDFISIDEEINADAPLQPRMDVTEILVNYLLLAREKRVADIVFDSANYGSNTSALSGTARWDTATGSPVTNILTALRAPLVRPNTMVIGVDAWDGLRTNPELLQYIVSRAQTSSGVTPLMVDEATVAAAFRLDRVVIGEALYNTAAEGASASYSRVWGKSCALIRVEDQPSMRRTQTFGYTMRFGAMETSTFYDGMPGRAGGTYIKVAHSDADEIVAGSSAAYLYTTVVS